PRLHLLHGLTLHALGELAEAEACLVGFVEARLATADGRGDADASVATARHHLGLMYASQGRATEAEAQWRAVLAHCPGLRPAWLGLGELLLQQGRWAELEEVAGKLAADPRGGGETALLLARGHLARREFEAARSILTEAIRREPQNLWLRVALSYAW